MNGMDQFSSKISFQNLVEQIRFYLSSVAAVVDFVVVAAVVGVAVVKGGVGAAVGASQRKGSQ